MANPQNNVNPVIKYALYFSIIGCCTILIFSQFEKMNPASPGTDLLPNVDISEYEDFSDECIDNLLEIGELLAQNLIEAIESFRCPIHNEPYAIVHEGDNIIVSDPNPELHGFSSMSVSTDNPDLDLL